MNINPVTSDIFREKLREVLQRKSEQQINSVRYPVVDIYTVDKAPFIPVFSPDPGEAKHIVDTPAAINSSVDSVPVPPVTDTSDTKPSQYAYPFTLEPFDPSIARQRLEEIVRRQKKIRGRCPYCSFENLCTNLTLRCGEREQYSVHETQEQRRLPHKCNYSQDKKRIVLIVEENRQLREFCRGIFTLFLRLDENEILSAGSVQEAFDIIRQCKIDKRTIGIALCGTDLPDGSCLNLVNELYIRNFNTDIILMQNKGTQFQIPASHPAAKEIMPGKKMVASVIVKPFHSDELVRCVEHIGIH